MTDILTVIMHRDDDDHVDGVAEALATLTHAHVRPIELAALPPERAVQRLLEDMAAQDVVLSVLGRDVPLPPIWPDVVRQATKPVVLVPPAEPGSPKSVSRALVPLDGTLEAAGAAAEAVDLFAKAGLDLLVLHVFDTTTAPRFWDQAAHARREWEQEFLARHCSVPGARLALRSGVPNEQVVDVASQEHVDLITLGWSQHLSYGRAQTVRRTIADASVPVMLVPLVSA